eukprot:PhF_6_TR41737/c0_g1_i2/m.63340
MNNVRIRRSIDRLEQQLNDYETGVSTCPVSWLVDAFESLDSAATPLINQFTSTELERIQKVRIRVEHIVQRDPPVTQSAVSSCGGAIVFKRITSSRLVDTVTSVQLPTSTADKESDLQLHRTNSSFAKRSQQRKTGLLTQSGDQGIGGEAEDDVAELANVLQSLKETSRRMRDRIHRDVKSLDSVEETLKKNIDITKQQHKELNRGSVARFDLPWYNPINLKHYVFKLLTEMLWWLVVGVFVFTTFGVILYIPKA